MIWNEPDEYKENVYGSKVYARIRKRRCTRCGRFGVVGWASYDDEHHATRCPALSLREWEVLERECHCDDVCRRCLDEAKALYILADEGGE